MTVLEQRLKLPKFNVYINPLTILLFLFFVTSSVDLINLKIIIFKAKPNNLIGLIFTILFIFSFRKIRVNLDFFKATTFLLCSLFLSALNSSNMVACAGFMAFFLFNYLVYFVIPCNLFFYFNPNFLLQTYMGSFKVVGIYATCQVLCSLFGTVLPGVKQWIFHIARGQGLSYEPSYYALYMTPYAFYESAKFILQKKEDRNIKNLLLANFFLLVSTSTGCFFSYLSFIFFMIVFSYIKLIPRLRFSPSKLVFKFTSAFLLLFSLLWILNRDLIERGFLKFFYTGISNHFSFYDRWRGLVNYWNIFLENPIVGVGLGGGTTYFLKTRVGENVDILDPDILTNCDAVPMNVTTEVFASLGIVGIIAFTYFFLLILTYFRNCLKIRTLNDEERINLISLALTLCVVFVTLQFNQSIMRTYLWLHVGICLGYVIHIKEKNTPTKPIFK